MASGCSRDGHRSRPVPLVTILLGRARTTIPLQHRTARRGPLPDLACRSRLLSRRNLGHRRAERPDNRGRQDRDDRTRIPLSRHPHAEVQAAVQPGRLRPGQGSDVRQWPAQDRTGPGDSRGHEATANRHQRCNAGQRAQARSQCGLSDCPATAVPKVRGYRTQSSSNGGKHAADDRA
jgi:hypothetical protein